MGSECLISAIFIPGGILAQDVIMLNFFPHLLESDYSNQQEFIFVVDRSGDAPLS
jgi:hypothetical protein